VCLSKTDTASVTIQEFSSHIVIIERTPTMATNYTYNDLPPLPSYTIKPLPSLLPFISDSYLALALPVIAYWLTSLFFHIIDLLDLFPQYRLHTPQEILKRNRASRWDVLRDVLIQHAVQTAAGALLAVFEGHPTYGSEDYDVAVWAQRVRLTQRAIPVIFGAVGLNSSELGVKFGGPSSTLLSVLSGGKYPQLSQVVQMGGEKVLAPAFAAWEMDLAKAIYWLIFPAIQFFAAVCILDSWQYFLHRGMHLNQWLYSKLYISQLWSVPNNHSYHSFSTSSSIRPLCLRCTLQPPS
jgi:sphinganine C4-monooxygenase